MPEPVQPAPSPLQAAIAQLGEILAAGEQADLPPLTDLRVAALDDGRVAVMVEPPAQAALVWALRLGLRPCPQRTTDGGYTGVIDFEGAAGMITWFVHSVAPGERPIDWTGALHHPVGFEPVAT